MNIVVKEFVPRLSLMIEGGHKFERVSFEGSNQHGFDMVKDVLEKVEEEFRICKKENSHLKERL